MHQPSDSAPNATPTVRDDAPSTLFSLGLEPTPLERPTRVRRSPWPSRLLGLIGGSALLVAGSCDVGYQSADYSTGLDNGTVSCAEAPPAEIASAPLVSTSTQPTTTTVVERL